MLTTKNILEFTFYFLYLLPSFLILIHSTLY